MHEALVEARASDDTLHSKLMWENLCTGDSKRRNLYNINNMYYNSSKMQHTLEGDIEEAPHMLRCKLSAEELEEIDSIAQRTKPAVMRPLFLSEICNALGLLAPSREDEVALGQRIVGRYNSIFKLMRDDGVSTEIDCVERGSLRTLLGGKLQKDCW